MTSIAVVLPVRNGARHLAAALRSVIGQTRAADEIIVVDDGSTDDSAEIAERFDEVRVYRRAAAGQASARNAGVDTTTASYVAFLDADDLMTPRRLEIQAAALDADLDMAGCVGHFVTFSGDDPSAHGPKEPGQLGGTLMVRRDVFTGLGGFDVTLSAGEYADWLLRARGAGARIAMLDDVTLLRRAHETNLTRDTDNTAADFLQVAHLAIQRARRAATTDESST